MLARFLRALGLDGASIPVDQDEREAVYRARLADRRVLVVLDNAASQAQVRQLLPGTPGCAVLVTSRARLVGLEGARLLDLEVLQAGQAVDLLARIVGGERVAAERQAAATIVGYCGYLPLAVRIAGARLAARPGLPLGHLASPLADERGRLDHLAAGDLEVRASLNLSYQALSGEQQRAFRLLGMLDVGDFSAWIAGPLLGIGQQQAAGLVDQLADAQLLDLAAMDATGTARYRFHDLVRIYARERAAAEDLPGARRMALARVTAGWLALAEPADARLPGVSDVITTGSAARWLLPTDLVDRSLADPLAWFELERTNLVAAVEAAAANGLEEPPGNRDLPGPGRPAWRGQSPSCLGRGLEADRDLSGAGADAPGCHRVRDPSLHLARMIGDTNIEADALLTLGSGYRYLGQPAEATPALEEAWQLALLLDLRHGQAFMMWHLAMLARDSGRPHAAGALLQQSLQLVRELQDRRGQAQLLLDLGQVRADEGRLELADALLAAALAAWPTHTENHGFRARTLDGLGRLRCRQQRYDDAVDHFAETASQYGELSAHAARARSFAALGAALVAAGRPQQARAARQQALVLQRRAGTPDENW